MKLNKRTGASNYELSYNFGEGRISGGGIIRGSFLAQHCKINLDIQDEIIKFSDSITEKCELVLSNKHDSIHRFPIIISMLPERIKNQYNLLRPFHRIPRIFWWNFFNPTKDTRR